MAKPKFSVVLPTRGFAETREFAERAEASGWDAVAVEDHFFLRGVTESPETPRLDCFTTLAAVAMITRRVMLSQIVACNSFRHPALTAKIAATLDVISGGRVELGLGAGWFREEYDAFGIAYPPPGERIAALAEAVAIVKRLWSEPVVDFDGRYYRLRGAYSEPKPVQRPRPRILLGGSGPALLRLAGEHADVLNLIPPTGGRLGRLDVEDAMRFGVEDFRRRAGIAREHARAAGRDPSALELSQFLFVAFAPDRAAADAMLAGMARSMGLDDVERARRSPNVLVGDAEACRDEIRQRQQELDVGYFVCRFPDAGSMHRFADDVIGRL
jgi:probable F420-dependent oxidoreductase